MEAQHQHPVLQEKEGVAEEGASDGHEDQAGGRQ
nr:unnamed protein product [Callosobruchus analis]